MTPPGTQVLPLPRQSSLVQFNKLRPGVVGSLENGGCGELGAMERRGHCREWGEKVRKKGCPPGVCASSGHTVKAR